MFRDRSTAKRTNVLLWLTGKTLWHEVVSLLQKLL
jgi:hypothetical protein